MTLGSVVSNVKNESGVTPREHRLARPADPEERGAALRKFERERQADDVAVEGDSTPQVADR